MENLVAMMRAEIILRETGRQKTALAKALGKAHGRRCAVRGGQIGARVAVTARWDWERASAPAVFVSGRSVRPQVHHLLPRPAGRFSQIGDTICLRSVNAPSTWIN